MEQKKVTVVTLKEKKKKREKIVALTAYDYVTARILNAVNIDLILVGDSLSMVVLGHENTLAVTMEEMLHHTRAVKKGNDSALLVADMPFMSYQESITEAIRNAGRFIKEAGTEAVKLEGGEEIAEKVEALVEVGIPVLGHIGLTPQSVHKIGGYKVQGKGKGQAKKLLEDAEILEEAGIFALVLECVPKDLAQKITKKLSVPTIGIGAGPFCDGQILVSHDLLGLYGEFRPRFVRHYAELNKEMRQAFRHFAEDVKSGNFPSDEESFK